MCELKICRICLRTEARMYKFDRFQLLYYYEEILKKKVNKRDGLPHYFCYECATILHKFHKFKEKCLTGHKMLKEMLWKGPITYARIYELDRKELNLKSSIDIIKVSKKVKTYNVQSTTQIETDDEDVTLTDNIDDSDDNIDTENEQLKYESTFPKYDEPEIYVDINPTEYKPLVSDVDLKPILSNDDRPNEDIQIEPSSSIFVEENETTNTLKVEVKAKGKKESVNNKPKANKKPHNFKMPTKLLNPKHWRKVVLSEEDAMKQFKARADNQKYLSWPFKCVDCLKGFSKEDILKRHRLIRHTERLLLECRFCRSRFKSNHFLRKHMRQHFTKYECLRCNVICPLESTAVFHDDYHNGVVKKCVHCNLEFSHKTSYYSHLRTHRSEHLCTLCGVSFVSPAGLKRHMKMKHVEDEAKAPEDSKEVPKTETFCEKCNIRFETKKAYDVHLLHSAMHLDGYEDMSNDVSAPQRRLSDTDDDLDVTKELDGDKTNTNANLGTSRAPFKYARKVSKKMGYSKKPMDCYQCGKHFDSQSACMRHHLAEHPRTSFYPNLDRHICEICGASLAPGSVPQHMNMHTREKMYPCPTCGRAFYASISLKRHLLTHTGEKPYGCTLCDKRFTQSNAMQLHFRTFHLKEPYPKRNRRKKEKAEEKTDDSDED